MPLERFPHRRCFEHGLLVELASETPGRGKINEYGVTLIALSSQTLGRKRLLITGCPRGRDVDLG